MYALVAGGVVGTNVMMYYYQQDAFGPPQPENITIDVQERAERVENAVKYTLLGREDAEEVKQAIESERSRSALYSISYSQNDYEITKNYRHYLSEAIDVVSNVGGNETNLTKEIYQMNAAKEKLY